MGLVFPSYMYKVWHLNKVIYIPYFFLSFQSTVVKKKMYYNMRVKTLQRNKADLLFRLETEKAVLQADSKNRIQKLYSAVKDVSAHLSIPVYVLL